MYILPTIEIEIYKTIDWGYLVEKGDIRVEHRGRLVFFKS